MDPAPQKTAVCKECGKDFQTELVFKMRGEKKIYYAKDYCCSPLCASQYRYRIKRTG